MIVDTGLGSGSVSPIIRTIGDDKRPIIVVNTHCHWDHIWGNWIFENNTIISHSKCRELEDKYWEDAYNDFRESSDGEVHKCLPNLVFEDDFKKTIYIYKSFEFDVCISGHNKPQGKNIAELMESALEDCWKKQIDEYGLPE